RPVPGRAGGAEGPGPLRQDRARRARPVGAPRLGGPRPGPALPALAPLQNPFPEAPVRFNHDEVRALLAAAEGVLSAPGQHELARFTTDLEIAARRLRTRLDEAGPSILSRVVAAVNSLRLAHGDGFGPEDVAAAAGGFRFHKGTLYGYLHLLVRAGHL